LRQFVDPGINAKHVIVGPTLLEGDVPSMGFPNRRSGEIKNILSKKQ